MSTSLDVTYNVTRSYDFNGESYYIQFFLADPEMKDFPEVGFSQTFWIDQNSPDYANFFPSKQDGIDSLSSTAFITLIGAANDKMNLIEENETPIIYFEPGTLLPADTKILGMLATKENVDPYLEEIASATFLPGQTLMKTETGFVGADVGDAGAALMACAEFQDIKDSLAVTAADIEGLEEHQSDVLAALPLKADLDSSGKILISQLPAIAITSTQTATSNATQLALTTQEGDIVIRTDAYNASTNPNGSKTWIRNAGMSGTMADFNELIVPNSPVMSIFGRVGAVVAAIGDYAASLISNDSNVTGTTVKDALNALLTAVNGKAAASHTHTASAITDFAAAVVSAAKWVLGTTIKSGAFWAAKSGTVSGGNLVVHFTVDGLSTGVSIFPNGNVYLDTLMLRAVEGVNAHAFGDPVLSNSNKTLTIPVAKTGPVLTVAGLSVLGAPVQANGSVIKAVVLGD